MKFLRISNPISKFGQYDYKGLDINQFIPGSQVYKADNTVVLVVTNHDGYIPHDDLSELIESEYDQLRAELEAENAAPVKTQTDQIIQLQSDLKSAQDAINMLLGL